MPRPDRPDPDRRSPDHRNGTGPGLVLLGEIGRAHGLRGEVRLKSYTADPRAIARYGPLRTERGASLTLVSVRPAGAEPDMLVARIEGVGTREAAEALTRTHLFVERTRLGEPEGEDEFFLADLIGLRAEDKSGAEIGRVVAVPDYGGGEMLEIAPPHGPTRLVPFSRACVPLVDVAGRRIVVVPPTETETRSDLRAGQEVTDDPG